MSASRPPPDQKIVLFRLCVHARDACDMQHVTKNVFSILSMSTLTDGELTLGNGADIKDGQHMHGKHGAAAFLGVPHLKVFLVCSLFGSCWPYESMT